MNLLFFNNNTWGKKSLLTRVSYFRFAVVAFVLSAKMLTSNRKSKFSELHSSRRYPSAWFICKALYYFFSISKFKALLQQEVVHSHFSPSVLLTSLPFTVNLNYFKAIFLLTHRTGLILKRVTRRLEDRSPLIWMLKSEPAFKISALESDKCLHMRFCRAQPNDRRPVKR